MCVCVCECVCVCVCCISNCILGPRLFTHCRISSGGGGDSLCSPNRNRNRNWAAAARSVAPGLAGKQYQEDHDQDQDPDCSSDSDSVSDSVFLLAGGLLQVDPSRFFCIVSSALCAAFGFRGLQRLQTEPKPSSEPNNKLQLTANSNPEEGISNLHFHKHSVLQLPVQLAPLCTLNRTPRRGLQEGAAK